MNKNRTVERIMKLRENKKREIEIEVRKAMETVENEKIKLDRLEKSCRDAVENFNRKTDEGSVTVRCINSYHDFLAGINNEICKQKETHARRENELEVKKNTLVNAFRDMRMMEILNNRNISREKKEKEKSDIRNTDFIAITRRSRGE